MKRLITYLLLLSFFLNCGALSFVGTERKPECARNCLAPFWDTGIVVVIDDDGREEIIASGEHSVVYAVDGFILYPDGIRKKAALIVKDVLFLETDVETEGFFDNEVKMFRQLSAHPELSEFIPALYEVYKEENVGVLIMEDISAGENPFHSFSRENLGVCRNLEEKLLVVREICRVIELLNDAGYVHLDLHSENIMFRMNERPDGTRYPQIKLIDLEDIEPAADYDFRALVRQIILLGGCLAEFFNKVDCEWIDVENLSELDLPDEYGIDSLITFMVLPSFLEDYILFRNMRQVSRRWDNVLEELYSSQPLALAA